MRISDWSSDVCSSDLFLPHRAVHRVDIIVEIALVLGDDRAAHDRQRVDGEMRIDAEFDEVVLRDEAAHLEILIRSEEHTSELQSLMRISYAVFCLQKKIHTIYTKIIINIHK